MVDDDSRQAARYNGAKKGGENRAIALTAERRQEIAKHAAIARWLQTRGPFKDETVIPEAAYVGTLPLGDNMLPCAVLDNGLRVLSERGVTKMLGGKRGGSHWMRLKAASPEDQYLPVFLSAGNLRPFINPSLRIALSTPVLYKAKSGQIGYGIEAILLGEICRVFRRAERAGALVGEQKTLATQAEKLYDGFAEVGIIALVDAATGYEKVRDRTELFRILEGNIAKALMPWTRRFPDDFYQELFRLRGWQYSPLSVKRPRLLGKLTNELVYEKLPPGVLEALKEANPVTESGHRRFHHHRLLTEEIGNKNLDTQLVAVITLMRASPSWGVFKKLFSRAFPVPDSQLEMTLGDLDEEQFNEEGEGQKK